MFFQYNCALFNVVHMCNYSERERERERDRDRERKREREREREICILSAFMFKEVLFHVYPFVIRCFNLGLLNLEPLSICKSITLHIKYMSL